MTDGPIVSEEDREAAATLCEHIENDKGEPVSSWAIDLIRAGKADHHCTVQAFARHRLAHSLPSQADAGGGVERQGYVATVPPDCDRIVWRGNFYGLAALTPTSDAGEEDTNRAADV